MLLQVAEKKLTLKNVTDYIVDVICKRSELGYNYGVILIPEGLIDFIPEVQFIIVFMVDYSLIKSNVLLLGFLHKIPCCLTYISCSDCAVSCVICRCSSLLQN